MTAAKLSNPVSDALEQHIAAACARVAPTWPLDRFIAVNPYWGWVGQPIEVAAGTLGTLAGTRLTMSRSWFQAEWAAGRLTHRHLKHAADCAVSALGSESADDGEADVKRSVQVAALVNDLVQALERAEPNPKNLARLPLISDLRDAAGAPRPGLSWNALITHQVSQHCAAYFDDQGSAWGLDRSQGLYGSWREQLAHDHGLPWRQGRSALHARLAQLPSEPRASIANSLEGLGIAPQGQQAYLTAVLLSLGGWAAWCAYQRWQARLAGGDDEQIEHLLAIRLAWEWLLHSDAEHEARPAYWTAAWAQPDAAAEALAAAQRIDWLLQHALEIAQQQETIAGLTRPTPASAFDGAKTPKFQAVFCIDVRSEVFRRALEAAEPGAQTLGFAGFFGLPMAYQPLGSALTRPQLPGLLSPTLQVTESVKASGLAAASGTAQGPHLAQVLAAKRKEALHWSDRWAAFRAAPSSAFSFVESLGLLYGGKLLSSSLASDAPAARWEDTGLPGGAAKHLRPSLAQGDDGIQAAAALAQGILTAMGLVKNFAPLVLIAGHGSQSANNAHASGLDCGACGGQSGEVNARVLADLLNRPALRAELAVRGIAIPADTHFVPGVHNTTTDDLVLFDTQDVPAPLAGSLVALKSALDQAGVSARGERAESLGLGKLVTRPAALHQAVRERANDWSQVRPEWGLANNASFIVAPRARSRNMNLAGRSFLHDYDHALDPENKVLTLIMTAPMVVTNWINLQYHASTVDNTRYGCGNKLLHNVVGGHIGVFEGNGGDLRIGLPLQSLHDGQQLRHTPLRLSVYIEAPRAAIESVLSEHATVRELVENGWLHLFCIDAFTGRVAQRWRGCWRESEAPVAEPHVRPPIPAASEIAPMLA